MNEPLNDDAQVDIIISNLQATEDEIKQLIELIIKKLGKSATKPVSTLIRADSSGEQHELSLKIINYKLFKKEILRDLLHSVNLVGWKLKATLVH